jgi:hemerythrin-like domain-containing protein
VCSYCGCQSEAVIATLMADHAEFADLSYGIQRALDQGRPDDAGLLTSRLAREFERHSENEEAGLFRQARLSCEGTDELDRLEDDHRTLRSRLGEEKLAQRPDRLRALLEDLTRHAEVEDNDFFPFVLQSLPDRCWEALALTVPPGRTQTKVGG